MPESGRCRISDRRRPTKTLEREDQHLDQQLKQCHPSPSPSATTSGKGRNCLDSLGNFPGSTYGTLRNARQATFIHFASIPSLECLFAFCARGSHMIFRGSRVKQCQPRTNGLQRPSPTSIPRQKVWDPPSPSDHTATFSKTQHRFSSE
jgi:hypothetical protein